VRVPSPAGPSSTSLAIPKSSSTGVPSARTITLPGLRSRCTTSRWWAKATARQIEANSLIRARRLGSRASHAGSVSPSTNSITR